MSGDGADYGHDYEYRVFSELDSDPDVANSGRRRLHLRNVWFIDGSPVDRPVFSDILAISPVHDAPEGENIERLLLELERMKAALEKPALILAEWQQHWASRKAAQDLDAQQAMTARDTRCQEGKDNP